MFREAAAVTAPGPDRADAPEAEWVEEIVADPVLLFRFSAITANAHRIHYDHAYATGVEGYPDLVVHGPAHRDPPRRAGPPAHRSHREHGLVPRPRAPFRQPPRPGSPADPSTAAPISLRSAPITRWR